MIDARPGGAAHLVEDPTQKRDRLRGPSAVGQLSCPLEGFVPLAERIVGTAPSEALLQRGVAGFLEQRCDVEQRRHVPVQGGRILTHRLGHLRPGLELRPDSVGVVVDQPHQSWVVLALEAVQKRGEQIIRLRGRRAPSKPV
jgi:hypothetical protein